MKVTWCVLNLGLHSEAEPSKFSVYSEADSPPTVFCRLGNFQVWISTHPFLIHENHGGGGPASPHFEGQAFAPAARVTAVLDVFEFQTAFTHLHLS